MVNPGTPVTPRPAATVLLVDVAVSPWQLLMMRRPGGADFAPGAYVFPGGSVHPEDAELGDVSRAAAVRELFDRECERVRGLLAEGASFGAALRSLELTPALDRLAFLARWITPEAVSRRFDTRFFVARRPPGQTVHPQPGEVADWLWTTPAAALAPDGPALVHATRRILESVAGEADAARLIARLRRRAETPPVMPRVVRKPDGGFEIVEDAAP